MTGDPCRDDVMELPDGRQLAWCEFGDSGGWPVLYCHGLPGSRLEPSLLAAAAGERGLRVLAPDRPGYGATSPRPGRTLGEEVDDLAALAERLDIERFDVLGFSGGGPHAMACAARLPDRVRRMGLVASWAPFGLAGKEGMADAFRQLWELAEADFPAFEETLEGAVREAGGAYGLLVGGAPDQDRAILEDATVAAAYRRDTEEALRQGFAGLFEDAHAVISPWAFDVGDVRCPARIWHGERDGNAPVGMGRWLARELPDAALTEWPGAAHFEAFRRWGEILDAHADH